MTPSPSVEATRNGMGVSTARDCSMMSVRLCSIA